MVEKLLTTTRTWNWNVNQYFDADTTSYDSHDAQRTRKEAFLAIKTGMLLGSAPFVSVNSHSETQGLGVDNLQTYLDLRWGTGPGVQRSWWQARNVAMGLEILFDHISSATKGRQMDVFVAPSGTPFTGGTATSRPTSTNEYQVLQYNAADGFGYWGTNNVTGDDSDYVVHVLHSDDGEGTRVVINSANKITGFWRLDRLADFASGWSFPFSVKIRQAHQSASIIEAMDGNYYIEQPNERSINNASTLFQAHIAAQSAHDVAQTLALHRGYAPNSFSGRHGFDPVEIINKVDVPAQRWGRCEDLWLSPIRGVDGQAGGVKSPRRMQGDDGLIYAWFGDFLMPWPDTTPIRWTFRDTA